jgi:excinuclease UvrABC ATPase subunit
MLLILALKAVMGEDLVLFEGVPEDLIAVKNSFTGKYLKLELN